MSFQTRIGQAFNRLAEEKKKGFIAYVTAGDPKIADTVDIVRRLADAGADVVELGIPFSDPLADGRVNQEAAERALKAGTNLNDVLEAVQMIRKDCDVPILFFSYLNPLFAYGFEKLVKRSAEVGVDGFLVLDLSMEESEPYRITLARHGIDNVCLVTPTSPDERIAGIVKDCTGFVYCVSRTGVTGARSEVQKGAQNVVKRTKKATELPVALGFGISTPEQAKQAAGMADAIVVGSAIVQRFHDAPHNAAGRAAAAKWVSSLVKAAKSV